jgi:hypothetical protein
LFKVKGDRGGDSISGMTVVAEETLLVFEWADDDACPSK